MTGPLDRSPTPAANVVAIVLAGGSGTRFGSDRNKVLLPIGGRSVLGHSLDTLERCDRVDAVIVVVRSGDETEVDTIVQQERATKVVAQVPGGAARQDSEWAGLTAAAEFAAPGAVVLLHDAARPFLTLDLLERLLAAAAEPDTIGVIPASGVARTIVDADGRPIPTDDLVRVQTPQAFELALLLDCYPKAAAEGFSGVDTAQTVQRFGSGPIRWVEGDPDNIKVTHPDDGPRAEALAARFADGGWTRPSP